VSIKETGGHDDEVTVVSCRRHSAQMRATATVQAQCAALGALAAKVSMTHGLNANLVHGWRKLMRECDVAAVVRPGGRACKTFRRCDAVRTCDADAYGTDADGHPDLVSPWRHGREDYLAGLGVSQLRGLVARVAAVIQIGALWLVVEPMDMPDGTDRLLASVVKVFVSTQAHDDHLTHSDTPDGFQSSMRASTSRCARSAAANPRSVSQSPPLNPLCLVRAFPSSVRGPVDFSHGRQLRIISACRARRSGVHTFAMSASQ